MEVRKTYNLADSLTGGLDTTPGRDIFACDDRCARGSHLSNETFVGDNAGIKIDFCDSISIIRSHLGNNFTKVVAYDTHPVMR